MEVGAVKQAYNNEVIQLKKNVNQAKLQIIHKLTRKAKTLTEKKAPDHLQEKNKKKAESAVKEVLIMKKLKPKDIAKFIITHIGDLNSHLNKPTVDNDKACARLLLHKSLQQKYKAIKNKFGNIPIKDLLMSRQERIKLKKEEKEAQKSKKKNKAKVVNSEGDWNVEDVGKSKRIGNGSKSNDSVDGHQVYDDGNLVSDLENCGSEFGSNEDQDNNDESQGDAFDESQNLSEGDEDMPAARQVVNDSDESDEQESAENDLHDGDDSDGHIDKGNSDGEVNSDEEMLETENVARPSKQAKSKPPIFLVPKPVEPITADIEEVLATLKPKKMLDKKVKDNKNKNLNEKMLNRKFKRDDSDSQNAIKVVDPFFKTSTGENYMSLAEPRQPDELKEVHSQGNRQERRAAMFGRAHIKPRTGGLNSRSDKFNRNDSNRNNFNSNSKFNRNPKYNDRDSSSIDMHSKSNNKSSNLNYKNYSDRNSKFNDRNTKNDNNSNYNSRNSTFDGRNSKYSNRSTSFKPTEPKEEKLHPSWEAKKKQSGILPFQGKKTVFDDN